MNLLSFSTCDCGEQKGWFLLQNPSKSHQPHPNPGWAAFPSSMIQTLSSLLQPISLQIFAAKAKNSSRFVKKFMNMYGYNYNLTIILWQCNVEVNPRITVMAVAATLPRKSIFEREWTRRQLKQMVGMDVDDWNQFQRKTTDREYFLMQLWSHLRENQHMLWLQNLPLKTLVEEIIFQI